MNCSQLYLGTDKPLPESESKHFSVKVDWIEPEERQQLQKILRTRYVYYLAPHTGCGCGWDFLDVGDEDNRESAQHLKSFLYSLKAEGAEVKVYSVCTESVGQIAPEEVHLPLRDFTANLSDYRVPYSSLEARLFFLTT